MKRLLCIPFMLLLASCENSGRPGEGVLPDTLDATDSLAAKADSATGDTLALDSLRVDSFAADQTRNYDTLSLIPTKDVNTKGVHPLTLVRFAETLKGVPYVYASANPKVGFDCSGFITYVFNHFGISVPRSSIDFTNVGREIDVKAAKRGDIILFTGTNPEERLVGHMGIVVSNADTLRFIHSTSGRAMGVTVTPLNPYYMKRFVKTIRVFPQNES